MRISESARPHKSRRKEIQCLYLCCIFGFAESTTAGGSIWEGLIAGVIEKLLEVDVDVRWEDIQGALQVDLEADARDAKAIEEGRDDGGGAHDEGVFDLEEFLQEGQEGVDALSLCSPRKKRSDGGDAGRAAAAGMSISPSQSHHQQSYGAPVHGVGFTQQGNASAGGGGASVAVDENDKAQLKAAADREESLRSAGKLDSMMDLTFAHLQRMCVARGQQEVLRVILDISERALLLAHRSKFTQYVLFHTICLDPQPQRSCMAFCKTMIERYIIDESKAGVVRLAALAYLSSFVARYARMPQSVIIECLQWLASFCVNAQTAMLEASQRAEGGVHMASGGGLSNGSVTTYDLRENPVIPGSCQALVYIVCYRLKLLLGSHPC